MAKNTSIQFIKNIENFINNQVTSGRFASVSEVVTTALRLFEQEETWEKVLINELKSGEKSGFRTKVDKKQLLKKFHAKHL